VISEPKEDTMRALLLAGTGGPPSAVNIAVISTRPAGLLASSPMEMSVGEEMSSDGISKGSRC
jgi:hypothetical protein